MQFARYSLVGTRMRGDTGVRSGPSFHKLFEVYGAVTVSVHILQARKDGPATETKTTTLRGHAFHHTYDSNMRIRVIMRITVKEIVQQCYNIQL